MLWLGLILFLAAIAAVIFLLFKVSSQTNVQLNAVTSQLNERLKEMSLAIQETHKGVGARLDNAANIIGSLQNSLGKLEESNRQIFEVGRSISDLQNLLRAPKFRGRWVRLCWETSWPRSCPKSITACSTSSRTGDSGRRGGSLRQEYGPHRRQVSL